VAKTSAVLRNEGEVVSADYILLAKFRSIYNENDFTSQEVGW